MVTPRTAGLRRPRGTAAPGTAGTAATGTAGLRQRELRDCGTGNCGTAAPGTAGLRHRELRDCGTGNCGTAATGTGPRPGACPRSVTPFVSRTTCDGAECTSNSASGRLEDHLRLLVEGHEATASARLSAFRAAYPSPNAGTHPVASPFPPPRSRSSRCRRPPQFPFPRFPAIRSPQLSAVRSSPQFAVPRSPQFPAVRSSPQFAVPRSSQQSPSPQSPRTQALT
jgi:hypothetical protein